MRYMGELVEDRCKLWADIASRKDSTAQALKMEHTKTLMDSSADGPKMAMLPGPCRGCRMHERMHGTMHGTNACPVSKDDSVRGIGTKFRATRRELYNRGVAIRSWVGRDRRGILRVKREKHAGGGL